MKFFLPVYILTFLAGTAAIEFLLPHFATAGDSGSPPPPAAAVQPAGAAAPAAGEVDAVRGAVESGLRFELPRAMGGTAEPPASAPLVSATGFDFSSLPPIPETLKASGRFNAWGVTQTVVPGPNNTSLPGGTFLEYADINATPLRGYYFANGRWNGPATFQPDKVVFFGGSINEAQPEHLRLLSRYYFLKGRLDTPPPAVQATGNGNGNGNPHAAEYKKLAQQYMELQEKTKKLTTERDAARGVKRDKAISELRKLKQEEAPLSIKLKDVQAKYNDWKAKNPAPAASSGTVPVTPEIISIRNEVKRLEPEVRRIVQ